MSNIPQKGRLIVISAPSGTGKTTVIDRLLAANTNLVRAITCTTRAPRIGEKDGRDYYFLEPEDFAARVQNGDFLEWANVHGYQYGTLRKTCMDLLGQGRDVVLNIDVQGALNVKKMHPESVLIFLSPPSLKALEERLSGRGANTADEIKRRIHDAQFELSMKKRYDYEVINDDLEQAIGRLTALITGLTH